MPWLYYVLYSIIIYYVLIQPVLYSSILLFAIRREYGVGGSRAPGALGASPHPDGVATRSDATGAGAGRQIGTRRTPPHTAHRTPHTPHTETREIIQYTDPVYYVLYSIFYCIMYYIVLCIIQYCICIMYSDSLYRRRLWLRS